MARPHRKAEPNGATQRSRIVISARLSAATAVGIGMTAMLLLAGCGASAPASDPAGAARGAAAIREYGCGACHRIAGIAGAEGIVGPPLDDLGRRVYVAGRLPNTIDNLARFIEAPQAFAPSTAMPDMGVTSQDAQAIAVYLSRRR